MDGHKMTAHIEIALTGDIIPVRRLAPLPRGFDTLCKNLRDADVAIGNFEVSLVTGGVPVEKLMNIKGDPELAQDLPSLGLDAVTLANNHVPDYGVAGMRATRSLVEGAGVSTVGYGETLDEAARPHVVTARGLRVGVLAVTCLTPAGMTAAADRPGLSPLRIRTSYEVDPWYQMEEPGDPAAVRVRTQPVEHDLQQMLGRVRAARATCDVLVISIHWGFGSGDMLAEYQEPLGRALIDAGADVVHGHHPHAIHPVAFHNGKPILFGLGTFVGQQVLLPASDQARAMWDQMSPDGVIALLKIHPDGQVSVRLVPHRLDENRMARPAAPDEVGPVAARLHRLSRPLGTCIALDGHTLVARPSCPGCINAHAACHAV